MMNEFLVSTTISTYSDDNKNPLELFVLPKFRVCILHEDNKFIPLMRRNKEKIPYNYTKILFKTSILDAAIIESLLLVVNTL